MPPRVRRRITSSQRDEIEKEQEEQSHKIIRPFEDVHSFPVSYSATSQISSISQPLTIKDTGILYLSIIKSRYNILRLCPMFQLYWVKQSSYIKKLLEQDKPVPSHLKKDDVYAGRSCVLNNDISARDIMVKLVDCGMTIGVHFFEIRIFIAKDERSDTKKEKLRNKQERLEKKAQREKEKLERRAKRERDAREREEKKRRREIEKREALLAKAKVEPKESGTSLSPKGSLDLKKTNSNSAMWGTVEEGSFKLSGGEKKMKAKAKAKTPKSKQSRSVDMSIVENRLMIDNLNYLARLDPSLNDLMNRVANNNASVGEIILFQKYIEKAKSLGAPPHADEEVLVFLEKVKIPEDAAKDPMDLDEPLHNSQDDMETKETSELNSRSAEEKDTNESVSETEVETTPVQQQSVETEPVQQQSVETEPVQQQSVETEPVQQQSVETEPVQQQLLETVVDTIPQDKQKEDSPAELSTSDSPAVDSQENIQSDLKIEMVMTDTKKDHKSQKQSKLEISKDQKLTAFQEKYSVNATVLFEFLENVNVRFQFPTYAICEVLEPSTMINAENGDNSDTSDILMSFLWIHNQKKVDEYEAALKDYKEKLRKEDEEKAKKAEEEKAAQEVASEDVGISAEKVEDGNQIENEIENEKEKENGNLVVSRDVSSEDVGTLAEKVQNGNDMVDTETNKNNVDGQSEQNVIQPENNTAEFEEQAAPPVKRRGPPPPRRGKKKRKGPISKKSMVPKPLQPPEEPVYLYSSVSFTIHGMPKKFLPILINSVRSVEEVQAKMNHILDVGIRLTPYQLWYQVDGKLDEELAEHTRVELKNEERKMVGIPQEKPEPKKYPKKKKVKENLEENSNKENPKESSNEENRKETSNEENPEETSNKENLEETSNEENLEETSNKENLEETSIKENLEETSIKENLEETSDKEPETTDKDKVELDSTIHHSTDKEREEIIEADQATYEIIEQSVENKE
ncbi:SWC3 [Candida oxycetoniae]|uniref:SWC3 n=1 Tax=Candida oxycetoniae TaxID=497107 RepID=A0AAI9SZ73_9ASCO|nr:SWC3 [Candida oxycetoniae]KAI3405712.2 SWC3 [Candida oxycetoniae]